MTASFPLSDLSRPGSAASSRLDILVARLQELGYEVRLMDVDLIARGAWRRVLAGEFATLADAEAEAHRLHQIPSFGDAQVIKY
jgi:hypothetical protein